MPNILCFAGNSFQRLSWQPRKFKTYVHFVILPTENSKSINSYIHFRFLNEICMKTNNIHENNSSNNVIKKSIGKLAQSIL